ncbi:MAG: NUDIX domain-containing protein [Pseudomonadota bacterium]
MYSMESQAVATATAVAENVDVIDTNLHDTIIAIDKSQGHYPIDKLDAHVHNIPHVAISIFLFYGQRLLIQRRALTKYHSGGLWANTVCTHPRWNESIEACAKRRLQEELGVSCEVQKFGEICYEAKVGHLYENEHVHCLIGHLDTGHAHASLLESFNPSEVWEVALLTLPELHRLIQDHPQRFTEWFKIYLSTYRDLIDNALLQRSVNQLCHPIDAGARDE